MILHLIIKNFGRIESADIALNNLVVFVGNNNSGKTMVMQLIYGLRKVLGAFHVSSSGVREAELNGQPLIRCDQIWLREVELQINKYLAEKKTRIVEEIFGSSIPVEEIKIALEGVETTYFVSSISEYQSWHEGNERVEISIDTSQYEEGENVKTFERRIPDWNHSSKMLDEAVKAVWRIILSENTASESAQLFLPASRSGLQLLYRYYFAGKTEENLVMPVKDFLRFLQLYTEDNRMDKVRLDLLKFGEEHLLQGKVVQRGDETFYIESQGGKIVPLYIASSMIHELAPFIKALGATQRIDWLYCDEVENSLHPLLQGEMARWLIRMVNAGMHIIISSHSDTMASRLNNLFMLTQLNKDKADFKMLSELELMNADLLRSNVKVGVYEFQSKDEGKTGVEKLEFISYPMMGYDFQLFSSNLDKLYNEADRITR